MDNDTRCRLLAMAIDTEGCIGFCKYKKTDRQFYPYMSFDNNSERLCEYVRDLALCDNTIYSRKNKRQFFWRPHRDNMLRVIKDMRPFLVVKIGQCDLMIEFFETCYFGHKQRYKTLSTDIIEHRNKLYDEMGKLNNYRGRR